MFDNMTHDKAYIIGFLLTDGNVYKNTISFELNQQDFEILQKIQNIFTVHNFKSNLQFCSKSLMSKTKGLRHYSRLRINSKILASELANFNIKPRKSFTVDLPEIEDEYFPSLLRGIVDGDGWIHERRNGLEIGICSKSRIFLQKITEKINKLLGISKKNISHQSKVMRISFFSNESLKILNYLYNTDSDMFLHRKRNKFLFFSKIISPVLWTKEQEKILLDNYIPGKKGLTKLISNLTGRSYKAVNKKIYTFKKLGYFK